MHPNPRPVSAFVPARRAFTLIELLTVIAIIGILAAIIIPTVGRVRQSASKALMTSNFRQIGTAVSLFAADNRDRMPGMYMADASGAPNTSYNLGGGQAPYIPTTGHNRNAIQSNEQLGRYLTLQRATVGGQEFFYCPLMESPRYASTRDPSKPRTPSMLRGGTVMASNGSLVYPSGRATPATFSMRFSQLDRAFTTSRRWMFIEIDQTTPTEVDPGLRSAGWYGDLPARPSHGGGWLAVMYDGSVSFLQAGDKRLNNLVN